MPATITTVTNAEAIKIDYKKKFFVAFDERLRLNKIAQRKTVSLGANVGDTVEFTRFLMLPDIISALTNEDDDPALQDMKTQTLQATIDLWTKPMKYSEKYKFTTIDSGMQEQSRLMGQQAANSFERDVSNVWGKGCGIGVRSDLAPAYEKHKVAVTAVTSATSFTCDALTQATNYWANARFVFTKQDYKGYGEYGNVSASSTAGVLTVAGLTSTPEVGQEISIILPTGLDGTQIINRTAVKRARKKLEWALAPTYKGGHYVGILDPDTLDDLLSDELVEKLFTHHSSGPRGIFDWSLGQVWGIDWSSVTKPYREDADTPRTLNASGDVHAVGIFGQNCIGVIDPRGHGLKMGHTPPEVAAPKAHNYGYLHWKAYRQCVGLNPTCSVILLTGATI